MSRGIGSAARRERIETTIRDLWGKRSTGSIGQITNLSLAVVKQVADELGLGPNTWTQPPAREPLPLPARPRGFTRAQVRWAAQAWVESKHPEAQTILGICGLLPGYPADKAAVGRGVA